MTRSLSRAVALLAAVFVLSGCGRAADDANHPFTIVNPTEPQSLNPLYVNGIESSLVDQLIYSKLLTIGADQQSVPEVATRVPSRANGDVSADGRTVTYRLRHDVRWQDGRPLTADDVVFTYRAVMNPRNAVATRTGFDQIAAIRAIGPWTVEVRTQRPYAPLLTFFLGTDSNYAILPKHLLARYASLDRVPFNEEPIGSGPYRVVRWTRGQEIRLEANPAFFRGKPHIAAISLRTIPDTNTAFVQLADGEADAAEIGSDATPARLAKLPASRVKALLSPAPGLTTLDMNVADPVMADRRVREAIASAFDAAVVGRLASGVTVTGDAAARGYFRWAYDPSVRWSHHDAARAATLLDDAGWVRGSDGVRRKAARRLSLRLITANGNQSIGRAAVLLQQQLAASGIDVQLQSYAFNVIYGPAGPFARGRWQLAVTSTQTGFDPDLRWAMSCAQAAPHGLNWWHYCDAETDRLLDEAAASFDRHVRRGLYRTIQQRVAAAHPFVPLWSVPVHDIVPASFSGLTPGTSLLSDMAFPERWRR